MKAIIRISGLNAIRREDSETLDRLRLRKKFTCAVLRNKPEVLGMIKKVRNYTAYGDIDKETLAKIIEKRGKKVDKAKKTEKADKIAEEMFSGKIEKKFEDFNIKPYFPLHPPRKGIKSKLHYPKGVLGDHGDKIKLLIERML
jgi:large subunit ribosomal protein L30